MYQFIIMGGQLDEMRKDQRPWLSISFSYNGNLHANTPISAMLSIVNKGKTPARAIKGDVAIDVVRNGEEPQLNYPLPHARFTMGLLFPGDPSNIPIEAEVVTQREFDGFQNGSLFFVAYANVSYKDFFGVEHWTKFCTAILSKTTNSFTGQKCSNYGDVDTN